MQQSNVIFFFIFAAFFVYITIRGELPRYAGFFFASAQPAAPVKNASGGFSAGDAASVAKVAATAAEFLL